MTIPSIKKNLVPNLRLIKNKLCLPVIKKKNLLKKDTFIFLNKSEKLSKIGWNKGDQSVSKLWRYNLHYFDDLNATGSSRRNMWHNELLKSWIDENKLGKGLGWEPYPTSLRIVNWIKWHLLGSKLSDIQKNSLALQAQWLSKRIEWHILGNHLFSNAKALVFSGLFFSNKESEIWLKKGLRIINEELNEQILRDGGNFELSPMYHAIFLEDLLDLINISQVYPRLIKKIYVNKWIKKANTMLKWLEVMSHPDGEISFFNDAAIDIAPNLKELISYANRMGLRYKKTQLKKITYLPESGYIRITSPDMALILDAAKVGPDYQPGHAHADTLSFELSLFGKRLFVNSGTSEYGISATRQNERSTKAHNTVVINNQNSSEVWSGFRVARRAYPFDLKIKRLKKFIHISCAHNGYKRLKGEPIHRRDLEIYNSKLIIKDSIEGLFTSAYGYFHLHPSIKIKKKNDHLFYLNISNGRKAILDVESDNSFIEKSYYSPKFGEKIETSCLKIALNQKEGSQVKIIWNDLNE